MPVIFCFILCFVHELVSLLYHRRTVRTCLFKLPARPYQFTIMLLNLCVNRLLNLALVIWAMCLFILYRSIGHCVCLIMLDMLGYCSHYQLFTNEYTKLACFMLEYLWY
jgi:hypothetical protein